MFNYIGDHNNKKIKITMRYNLYSFNWKKINLIAFMITLKIMKYLGIYLKHVQDLCAANYTTDRSQRRHKPMEKSTIFMDRKTEHSTDVNYPQIDL